MKLALRVFQVDNVLSASATLADAFRLLALGTGCEADAAADALAARLRPDRWAPLQALLEGDVAPSPATHAILTALKAGESVFQTLLLTKTVFHAYEGAQPLSHALFWCQNTV